ncbi:hypothetical protein B0H17DRAFT_1140847 [Mycena rosella]|uniref:Uncharacterized protein n=1 Tax=Mycena rosella TaxID=1033263 RepID=A0AAD7GAU5_MYCRO|nr:hypothetical protein B0H17DRAFT_1140847 [Mycena rosella]
MLQIQPVYIGLVNVKKKMRKTVGRKIPRGTSKRVVPNGTMFRKTRVQHGREWWQERENCVTIHVGFIGATSEGGGGNGQETKTFKYRFKINITTEKPLTGQFCGGFPVKTSLYAARKEVGAQRKDVRIVVKNIGVGIAGKHTPEQVARDTNSS